MLLITFFDLLYGCTLIFAILIIANSCNKDEPFFNKTIVEGIATVKQTNEPLENVTILINYVTNDSHNIETIAELTTDEKGHFSYKFEAKDNYYHYILISKNCYSIDASTIKIKKEKRNEYNLLCNAITNIVFHIVNTNPYNENDKIEFFKGIDTISRVRKIGDNINYFFVITTNSYEYFNYTYEVTKNNITTTFSESIYIDSFCTYDTITINY